MSLTVGLDPRSETLQDCIRVLVVDDHQAVASAMALAIGMEPGLTSVGSAHSASDARELVEELSPDVVVMDVLLGDADGIDVAAEMIRGNPGLRVVVLTGHVDEALLRRAAEAGAGAFLLKDGALADLLEAIRTSSLDGLVVHPRVIRDLFREAAPVATTASPLTARETEVLMLLSEGHNTASIAGKMGITRLTCRGYVKNLLVKLHAHSQLEAVVSARKHGLIGA
ncbi:response regulator transcription factor [Terrabacter terrigena]|uniref:Response regulator n=1 Tax=Terrabacter terrigena TaxID=574718 RepID=A0ABW3MXK6_9MICO